MKYASIWLLCGIVAAMIFTADFQKKCRDTPQGWRIGGMALFGPPMLLIAFGGSVFDAVPCKRIVN